MKCIQEASSARDDYLDLDDSSKPATKNGNGNTRRKIQKEEQPLDEMRWTEDQRKLIRTELTWRILINQDPQSQNPTQKTKKKSGMTLVVPFNNKIYRFFNTLESPDSPAEGWQMLESAFGGTILAPNSVLPTICSRVRSDEWVRSLKTELTDTA
jgi:hypothetical protein